MKTKIRLAVVTLFAGFMMQAQTDLKMNAFKIHPLHFLRTKVQYERHLNDKLSVGVIGSLFTVTYNGFRIEPYLRYYPFGSEDKMMEGFYMQLKGHYTDVVDKSPMREIFTEYGYSVVTGYQFVLSKRYVFDFYAGGRSTRFAYPAISESAEVFKLLYCAGLETGVSLGFLF